MKKVRVLALKACKEILFKLSLSQDAFTMTWSIWEGVRRCICWRIHHALGNESFKCVLTFEIHRFEAATSEEVSSLGDWKCLLNFRIWRNGFECIEWRIASGNDGGESDIRFHAWRSQQWQGKHSRASANSDRCPCAVMAAGSGANQGFWLILAA